VIYPDPKPPRTVKKPRKPLPRSYVVTRRRKARKGRLKGEALSELRRKCFDRDRMRCVDCGDVVTWESGHMAHVGGKRRHGDSLSNVRTKCGACHRREHLWGKSMTKPVPPK
jgi:5-methylcytosine-specific restriction endonuclease McrA